MWWLVTFCLWRCFRKKCTWKLAKAPLCSRSLSDQGKMILMLMMVVETGEHQWGMVMNKAFRHIPTMTTRTHHSVMWTPSVDSYIQTNTNIDSTYSPIIIIIINGGICHRHIPNIIITDKFPPWWELYWESMNMIMLMVTRDVLMMFRWWCWRWTVIRLSFAIEKCFHTCLSLLMLGVRDLCLEPSPAEWHLWYCHIQSPSNNCEKVDVFES